LERVPLTLFAQDAQSKLMLYTAADIRRVETDDQVMQFLKFWRKVRRGVSPVLVFDSRFTTYDHLSQLEAAPEVNHPPPPGRETDPEHRGAGVQTDPHPPRQAQVP
jgi:hypothetical protein